MPSYDILMIVKDESGPTGGLATTIASIPPEFSGRILIYDTGSTDDTVSFAKTLHPAVHVTSGEFKNFAHARNAAQRWAAADMGSKRVLWLDANDEMSGTLKPSMDEHDALLIQQVWKSGDDAGTQFYNYRCFNLQPDGSPTWFGYVHEWVQIPSQYSIHQIDCAEFKIVQDRGQNCDNSVGRWGRDVDLLKLELQSKPNDSRTLFYLGRALKDTGQYKEAKEYLSRRLELPDFPEERFWAQYYLAEIYELLGEKKPFIIAQMFLASYAECGRVEGLVAAARIFIREHKWHLAYMCLATAITIPVPSSAILFLVNNDYEYQRWHLMGIVAFYVGQMDVGSHACNMAIKARNQQIDKDNLKWYGPVLPQ